jgi:signal transduction histidine kinase/GAF domain-containing protein
MEYNGPYKLIGKPLLKELLNLLKNGEQIALLGPRRCGKALILQRLINIGEKIKGVNKPKIIKLIWDDYRKCSANEFAKEVAKRMKLPPPDRLSSGMRLSGKLETMINKAVSEDFQPLWIFVQDIVGFPVSIARELLYALQACYHNPVLKNRIGAIVTGSCDFIPLTYEQLSPFYHAKKIIIVGMTKEFAKILFYDRRLRLRGEKMPEEFMKPKEKEFEKEITSEGFSYLYKQTGGSPHLIQEIVLATGRHSSALKSIVVSKRWEKKQIQAYIEHFVEVDMPNDFYCRMAIMEIARQPEAFDLLLKIREEGYGKYKYSLNLPDKLEIAGLIKRDTKGKYSITCPVWHKFLQFFLTPRYIADIYACQHRWENAWKVYRSLPSEQRYRSISGDTVFRLRSVLSAWEDSFLDQAFKSSEAVWKQFILGIQYLLGFDSWGIYDKCENQFLPIHPDYTLQSEQHLFIADERTKPAYKSEEGGKYWLDEERLRVYYDPQISLTLSNRIKFVLCLGRKDQNHQIDTATQEYLRHVLGRFKYAYATACDFDRRKDIGDLRKKHLEVIGYVNSLLTKESFDMGKVVQGAADSLVNIAGYYRILICLVDATRKSIQGVASQCAEKNNDFYYGTDYPLENPNIPIEDWNVQPWVVKKGKMAVIPDVTLPTQRNPRVRIEGGQIGMKSFAVVPMVIENQKVIGTIHFERHDKKIPSEIECRLFVTLAGQLAVMFSQAQRITLLQKAIYSITDELRIVNPDRQVIFLNEAATEKHPGSNPGWQLEPFDCLCRRVGRKDKKFVECLINEAKKSNAVHHYSIVSDDGKVQANDWLMAPIDDFRTNLKKPFTANSRIGYVERVHDLTDLYEMIESLQKWFAQKELRSTAKEILRYFERRGFKWCRIYLVKWTTDGKEFLQSLEEIGLVNPSNKISFRQGEVIYPCIEDDQPWHVILIAKQPSVYKYDDKCNKGKVMETLPIRGFPCYLTNDVYDRDKLEKKDDLWIEAPLIIGNDHIGKITLFFPPEILPEEWELMKITIVGVAVSLNNALHNEQEAKRIVEETWKMAAAEAVHQLVNKINPLESWLFYGLQDISLEARKTREYIERASENLKAVRGALNNFGFYASEKPFEDIENIDLNGLLNYIALDIKKKHPETLSINIGKDTPLESVTVSKNTMLDVFEILVHNSIYHSKKSPSELNIVINAVLSPPPKNLKDDRKFIRIEYLDNGIGIPENIKDMIFLPFRSFSPKGTGLGLAIARRYVRRQGGEMTEEGEYNKGVCFVIYLPIVKKGISK